MLAMRDSFISTQVRRGNRNLLLTNLGLIMLLLVVAFGNYDTYHNLLCGPFEMSMESVEAIKDVENLKNNHVKVRGVHSFDTGMQYLHYTYETGTDKIASTTVKADYHCLVLRDKFLVVETAPDVKMALTYSGILKPMPQDLKKAILEDDDDLSPEEFDELVLPFYLETQVKKTGSYVKLAVWTIVLLLALRNIFVFVVRTADRGRHPIYRNLASHGDPAIVADEIDDEMEKVDVREFKNLSLSKSWLIRKSFFGTYFIPFDDILWIYKSITRQRVNFIPVGKSYSLQICPRDRKCWTMSMKGKDVNTALAIIGEKAPKAFVGYSDELKYMWERNFPAFIEAVQKKGA